jgi:Ser/Thr protein kinase RdoA (MazF antagonist)
MNDTPRTAELALAHRAAGAWDFGAVEIEAVEIGNINLTFVVLTTSGRYVLQRLNPIFAPEVHHDIDAVTGALAAAGVLTPRLVPTAAGNLWWTGGDGHAWRLQTYVEGVNHSRLTSTELAGSAGELLARFHAALADFDYTFRSRRLGVHDTPAHVAGLRVAIGAGAGHPAFALAAGIGREILERLDALPPLDDLPQRIVHGDPKINNIMFDDRGRALCFIDLDTVGRMPVPVELGDAFRSWCNPGGEGQGAARFALDYCAAALHAYAGHMRGVLTPAEVAAIPTAVETITLELAARFCRDALEESYFAWDRSRYAAAWEHHIARAESQLHLARAIAGVRGELGAIVEEAFASR